jgi:hypothetical protein
MCGVSNTVMSLNGVSNTVFPNTLNGLDSLDVTNITIDGQSLASLFVTYTGAQSNVDLNAKSLTGVNSISASAVTASGLVQGQNVTATALTTTDTIRINTVPAGTTAKYLATNATGDVIEADITTKYVPYAGSISHVNLNAKNLSNVLTYSGTNVQVTSTETTSLLATGTTQVNTLRITNVQVGTQQQLLAVDSVGNVINGTIPVPTTIDVTVIPSPSTYYPIWVNGTSGGNRTLYSDNGFQSISYDTGAKTLSTYQLKLLNVPAGTQTSILAVDSAGNVIQGTAPPPTQLLTTAIPAGSISYWPTLISDRATGNKSYFNENSANTSNMYFQAPTLTSGLGTWNIPQLVINSAITLFNARFSVTPTVTPIGSVSYAIGLNATNDVVAYVPSNQVAVTATIVNADFNLLFTATSTTDPNITLNIDSGTNLKYNPATDRLTVPNLTVGTAATINDANLTGVPVAPTAAPFTNTTQIATTAFVLNALGSSPFLPLSGGVMTGTIVFDNTVATAMTLNSSNLTAYTYSIRDSFWNLPMLEFTTKTLSTFGSVSFGVPIVITNTSSTNLMSLPYSASTAYSKSISNTGGDLFITFTGRTSSSSGSAIFGNSVPVSINDTLSMNPASAGILCNTYKNISNATLQIQGFWSGANSGIRFDANSTNNSAAPALYANINSGGTTFYNGNTTQQERLTIINDRVKVSFVELAVSSQTYGQVRMIQSETGYGTFWRNDNADFYLLITANGDPYGVWNSLRPFYINLASGRLYSNQGQSFQGGTDTNVITFQDGRGLQTATGSPYGNVSVYGTGVNTWNGYDINRRYCLMGLFNNAEAGFHDNTYSWIWRTTANNFIVDRPSVIYTNLPQQSYAPNQILIGNNGSNLEWGVMYSTYRYGGYTAWGGGTVVSSFYKASATAQVRISGAASYYVPGAGMYQTECQFLNLSTGVSYYLYQYQFTNVAYNHVSYPICFQFGGLPVGSYNIVMWTNAITDGNDHVYILGEIIPF